MTPDDQPAISEREQTAIVLYRGLFIFMAFHAWAIVVLCFALGNAMPDVLPPDSMLANLFLLYLGVSMLPLIGLSGLLGRDPAGWRTPLIEFSAWLLLAVRLIFLTCSIASTFTSESSPRYVVPHLFFDLLWLLPILYFLLRHTLWQRPIIVWLSVVAHVVACITLLMVAPGTEIGGTPDERREFVAANATLWTAVWIVWAAASSSFLAFAIAWTAKIWDEAKEPEDRWWSAAACVLAIFAVSCDLAGESTLIGWLPGAKDGPEFLATYRLYQWFSPAIANGLYGVVGLILSVISWRQGWLTGLAGTWGFVIWAIALALTLATIIESNSMMFWTGAGLMVLFLPWSAWVGWEVRGETGRT